MHARPSLNAPTRVSAGTRGAEAEGGILSKFTETMYGTAQSSSKGLVTGEPNCPVRHTWGEVHERARRIAGGLAAAGVGRGDAVAVLAGAPVEIAPAGAGHLDARRQPHHAAPAHSAHRLARWAEETTAVIKMIGAKTVVISDPFMAAAPLLSELGMRGADHRAAARQPPDRSGRDRRRRRRAAAADVGFHRIAQGRADHPPQRRRQRRGDVRRRKGRHRHRRDRQLAAAVPRHGHDRLPDRADVFRCRTGQGHADGLPARHAAVGQAHRQVQGHDDRGAQLRLHAVRQTPAQAGRARPVRPVHACGGRCRAPNRSNPPTSKNSAKRASRSGCVPKRSCRPTAWPRRPWRCRSPSAARAWSSTRSTPTCSPYCTGLSRRPRAKPGDWPRSGRLLEGLEARIVDEDGNILPARGVGVIEVRGESVTLGYTTMAGFVAAQDDQGWYDTGDLGYLTETGHIVVCGRVKDVIIMAGRNIYPTDIERAAARVSRGAAGLCRGGAPGRRGTRGRRSLSPWSPTTGRTQPRCAASSSRWRTRWLPRSMSGRATSWCSSRERSPRRRRASCGGPIRWRSSADFPGRDRE